MTKTIKNCADIRLESLLTANELADYFYYSGMKKRNSADEKKYQALCNKLKSRRERKLAYIKKLEQENKKD